MWILWLYGLTVDVLSCGLASTETPQTCDVAEVAVGAAGAGAGGGIGFELGPKSDETGNAETEVRDVGPTDSDLGVEFVVDDVFWRRRFKTFLSPSPTLWENKLERLSLASLLWPYLIFMGRARRPQRHLSRTKFSIMTLSISINTI